MADLVHYESVTYPLIPRETPTGVFIEQWLHGRPQKTQKAYRREAYRFLFSIDEGQSLNEIHLNDLQEYADTLSYMKPASKARALKAIKSLFTFAERTGYLQFNVGAAVRLPKVKRKLAERILSEEQVQKIIAMEIDPRNHALLRFLYISGARVSEACKLTWRDFQGRGQGMGQVTLDGKGEKERTVLLPASLYQEVIQLRRGEDDTQPVFLSQKHGHLDPSQVHRIVEAAAVRANVLTYTGEQRRKNRKSGVVEVQKVKKSRVSPHFLRHSHASHALDRNVPPHVVQATLGHASLETTTFYSHARPDTSSALKLA